LAKIAVELEQALTRRAAHGAEGGTNGRLLAQGDGWIVEDVICTHGPADHRFEEQHSAVAVVIVAAGTFQYDSPTGHELLTPGSLMLGTPGQCFECGHEHASGDRCVSFRYAPDYFERLVADVGASARAAEFRVPRIPPVRELAPIVARACAGVTAPAAVPWEELSIRLAARVVQLVAGRRSDSPRGSASAVERVTRAARAIERRPAMPHTVGSLAREAGLSPYHFLRTFERLTGLTPHQYVRRARLREAAMQLAAEPARVIDIAFESGFGDLSNFNRAFRTEFGVSPLAYRADASKASRLERASTLVDS
jgi:AraC family transcriptional regulator